MSKKYITVLITLIIIMFSSITTGRNMSIFQNQPVFKLNVETFGTKHIININGVSLISDMDSNGQSEKSLPINHLMRSGFNTLEVYVFPDKPNQPINVNSRVNITLSVTSNSSPENIFIITDIDFQGANIEIENSIIDSKKSGKLDSSGNFSSKETGDSEIYDIELSPVNNYKGAIKLVRKINIPSSLPLWAFFNSDNMPDFDSMTDEQYYKEVDGLLSKYLEIQLAINNKNIDSIISSFKERNAELDKAFYQPSGTYDKKIAKSLSDAANDDALELVDLKKEYVNFTVEDNNKLTSLTRDDFKPALSFNFKSGTGSQNYPLIFRLQDGKWILTR